jgi:hypothetical protein
MTGSPFVVVTGAPSGYCRGSITARGSPQPASVPASKTVSKIFENIWLIFIGIPFLSADKERENRDITLNVYCRQVITFKPILLKLTIII